MLCCVITGPTYEDVKEQILKASAHADILEIRWDCFDSLDFVPDSPLPFVFTLRPTSQGGYYTKSEESRLESLEKLLYLNPAFVDLEYIVPLETIKKLQAKFPLTKTILSYHDFDKTPDDLSGLLKNLQKKPAHTYKIATFANSTIDALRMINFSKQHGNKLIALCMGELGMISRTINHFTYCTFETDTTSKLGQLPLDTLIDCYRYKSINSNTQIYGLIGDPVDKSRSNITHNEFFKSHHLDAVYIKMNIKSHELDSFFNEIKSLNIKGLSVTMPLKEAVMPYLNQIDPKALSIGAVNTIVFENQQLIGFNTDCTGALDAIEKNTPVQNKKVLIIGAGGSARAIAHEACLRGAHVTILNRNIDKALTIANGLKCHGDSLENIKSYCDMGYDILVNCTPDEMPFDPCYILEKTTIMDIKSTPKWTKLLTEANKKNCPLIFGYDMFVNQAIAQFHYWGLAKIL